MVNGFLWIFEHSLNTIIIVGRKQQLLNLKLVIFTLEIQY